jgi:hypothetical protein
MNVRIKHPDATDNSGMQGTFCMIFRQAAQQDRPLLGQSDVGERGRDTEASLARCDLGPGRSGSSVGYWKGLERAVACDS